MLLAIKKPLKELSKRFVGLSVIRMFRTRLSKTLLNWSIDYSEWRGIITSFEAQQLRGILHV